MARSPRRVHLDVMDRPEPSHQVIGRPVDLDARPWPVASQRRLPPGPNGARLLAVSSRALDGPRWPRARRVGASARVAHRRASSASPNALRDPCGRHTDREEPWDARVATAQVTWGGGPDPSAPAGRAARGGHHESRGSPDAARSAASWGGAGNRDDREQRRARALRYRGRGGPPPRGGPPTRPGLQPPSQHVTGDAR